MKERVEFGDNPSIMRIEEKCTRCGMCKLTCNKINNIGDECIRCGQCILTCPMGALVPKFDYQTVLNYLNDTEYTCIVSIAPATRVSLIKELNLENCDPTRKLVGILKALGFDYVYDIAVGADVTTIEESVEFIERLKEKRFPLMTSCCPSWKKYAINHDLDKYVSSTKSPIKMQGYLVKEYLPKYIDFTKKVVHVILMPCISKKEEILDDSKIDYVITNREFLYMLKEAKIDIDNVVEKNFDQLLGNATSSGIIFGTSGGVLESVLRTTYYLINNKSMPKNQLSLNLDNDKLFSEAEYDFGSTKIKVARVCTMAELQKINIHDYHLIEVMACPGGCINGGGQPLVAANVSDENRKNKSQSLLNIDDKQNHKPSYLSKEVEDLYHYDVGIPGGKTAHKKLHD